MKTFRTISLVFLLFAVLQADAQFTLSGTLRPRFEYRNGYSHLPIDGTSPAFFITNRTRLTADYLANNMEFRLTAHQVNVWGDRFLKEPDERIGIYEAWAKLYLCPTWSIKFGRQAIKYDNQRIISENDFRQGGQTHDALLFMYKDNGWDIHLGTAFNQTSERTFDTYYPNVHPNSYKTLNFLYAQKVMNNITGRFLGIMDGHTQAENSNKIYSRFTFGPALEATFNPMSISGRFFYQTGKTPVGLDVSAFYGNLDLGAKLMPKISVTTGFELLSGNKSTTPAGESNAFDIIYGAGHALAGHMDYFTSFPAHTKGLGLTDIYLKMDYATSENTSLYAHYHYMAIPNDYNAIAPGMPYGNDKYLGSEVDLGYRLNFVKDINLQFGYSFLLANEAMGNFKVGNPDKYADWGWVMLTVNPTFFKIELPK